MANTYTSLWYHIVFSTKNREPTLNEPLRERLWPYLGGIARQNACTALEVGGVADHVHVVLTVPPAMSLSRAVQQIKGASSHWLNTAFPRHGRFAWQDGYGAFTANGNNLAELREYVRRQPEHHRRVSFEDEYREFLGEHGIEFDDRYLLG